MTKLSVKMRSHSSLRPETVLKKKLRQRCFLVNFAKFLRTPFLIEHLRWLLLSIFLRIFRAQLFFAWYSVCEKKIEAVIQTCSAKKVFLEISQNSQENTCARVSFLIKLQALGRCFPDNFVKFLRPPFYWQNTSGGCFWKNKSDQKKKR